MSGLKSASVSLWVIAVARWLP